MKKLFFLAKNEDGQSIVFVALIFVVLLVCVALVVDIGHATAAKQELQAAADAAALAGARTLPNTSSSSSQAAGYAGKNGVQTADITVVTPYNGDSTKIEVICKRTVPYTFARILGIRSATVQAVAVAQQPAVDGEDFGYTVFAGGGDVNWTGGNHTINGSVYGRDGVSMNGNSNSISGDVSYYDGSASISGTVSGSTTKVASALSMPDFSQIIKSLAIAAGTYFDNESQFEAAFNGKTVDGPVYVNGGLTINGRIKGTGIICTNGSMSISEDQDPSDSVCFYSATGSITFNGGTGLIYGIVYAPNGSITIHGGPNGKVYGRLIAKTITVRGSKFSVSSDTTDTKSIDSLTKVKLVQ